ncbi:MAG TPA: phosphotransferase family protein [Candidatus Dormibacteraeota bacterium]
MSGIQADLERQLGRRVLGLESIPEGHSGFTYWVDLEGGERAVLRLPPPGARIAGPADIPRQGRLMRALCEAGLPVPAILAMSDEPVVDGRPFVLMARIDGARIEGIVGSVPDRQLAGSAVEVLKRLHALPLERTGIGGEEPQPLEAEMMRWAWLMERAPAELTQRAPLLGGRLAETRPAPQSPTLVHGDYHYGNMLFREGRVVGVLDWEIAQIGQPLLDLACLSVVAHAGRAGEGVPGGGKVDVDDGDLLEMYGADPADYTWYLALTYYKYASIFGYNLMLHWRGKRPDPTYETRTTTIVEFIEEGIRLLG